MYALKKVVFHQQLFLLLSLNKTSLEDFVTEKALDGLFFMVAEKERAIRKDPVGQVSGILQKVFGALR